MTHTDISRQHAQPRRDIAAALIDMDGTLYDSMPLHADAWMQMCREEGLTAVRDDFFLFEGRTGASTIDLLMRRNRGRAATDDECRRLYARKAELFRAMAPPPVMPGAREMVDMLRDRGIVTVLVTGSGQSSLLRRLESDFPGAFPDGRRVTSSSVKHGKPHPEPFIMGARLAGVPPRDTIAIDNAPLGVQSAAAAGAFTIGVVTGPVPATAMRTAGADIVYDSMPECSDRLAGLLDTLHDMSFT